MQGVAERHHLEHKKACCCSEDSAFSEVSSAAATSSGDAEQSDGGAAPAVIGREAPAANAGRKRKCPAANCPLDSNRQKLMSLQGIFQRAAVKYPWQVGGPVAESLQMQFTSVRQIVVSQQGFPRTLTVLEGGAPGVLALCMAQVQVQIRYLFRHAPVTDAVTPMLSTYQALQMQADLADMCLFGLSWLKPRVADCRRCCCPHPLSWQMKTCSQRVSGMCARRQTWKTSC